MTNIKLSIIVPVYNTEPYLCECLDSIINQTIENTEIICVNDGSTDNSLEILERYAKMDSRIKIFTIENSGSSIARNYGMSHAKGEYVGFVDSDDYIDLEMFEKLYAKSKAKNLDICMCKISTFEDGTDIVNDNVWYFALNDFNNLKEDVFTHKDTKEFICGIAVTPFNKIYKRSFIEKNNIEFPKNIIFEDEVFFYDCYLRAKRVSIVKENLYYYRRNREGSIVEQTDDKDFSDMVKIFKLIRDIFIETDNYEEYKTILSNHFISVEIWRYGLTSQKYRESFFKELKEDTSKVCEDKKVYENLSTYLKSRVDNLLDSSNYKEFDLKEHFKEISVIITCCNDENTIEQTILSVIHQKMVDFEKYVQIVIVDDGSFDKTKELCEKYVKSYPDNILYCYQERLGKSKAMNTGIKYTKGKYFFYLDGDSKLDGNEFSKFNFD